MAPDYRILYRRQLDQSRLREVSPGWDFFISAFNTSDRVTEVFANCDAKEKHWIAQPEYRFTDAELPSGSFRPQSLNEAEFWAEYLEASKVPLGQASICIDSTGFMRPHLAFWMALMFRENVSRFSILYSDPVRYVRQERTQFTKGPVSEVRQVSGFEGVHRPEADNDLVIIGAGFDSELIRRIAEDRSNARKKVQMFGLPSLEPDMYQQSVISAEDSAEAVGAAADVDTLFAPANDPFVTAQVLQEKVMSENLRQPISNLYLASVGTKPQMLGFALYYLVECQGTASSMLFPFAESYSQETSEGLARTWLYEIEFLQP